MTTDSPTLRDRLDALRATIERVSARGLPTDVDHAMLFRSLLLVGRALQSLSDEAMERTGLSEAEFRVLVQLYSQPDGAGSPSELCGGVWQSPANMTRLTDQLVARGLISREPSEQDRRRTVLAVTEQGAALLRGVVPRAFEPVRRAFAPFSAQQRAQLQGLVNELVRSLDTLNEQPSAAAGDGAH